MEEQAKDSKQKGSSFDQSGDEHNAQRTRQLLEALRDANQLVVQCEDTDSLISKAAELLTEIAGYQTAWIALVDAGGDLKTCAAAGLEDFVRSTHRLLEAGKLPLCASIALSTRDLLVSDQLDDCANCPLSDFHVGSTPLAKAIRYGNETFGVMGVSVPEKFASDKQELAMFEEFVSDFAVGLHHIRMQANLREAYSQAQASEGKLQQVLLQGSDGIVLCDSSGRIVVWNRRQEEITGVKHENALGSFVWDVQSDLAYPAANSEDIARMKEQTLALFETREASPSSHIQERQMRRADGAIRTIETSTTFIHLDDDFLVGRVTRDVTEARQAEDELREATLRMKSAVNAGNVGLWDWDLVTNETYYSPEWKAQIGYTEDEIANEFSEWQSRVHPDDLDATLSSVKQAIAKISQDHVVEFRFRHKDGSYRWIMAHAAVITDDRGTAVRMLGSHVDITRRKRAEESLRISEQLLNEAGDMARVGGWEIDLATDTVIWTRATRAIHEVPDDYMPTLDEAILFFPEATVELTEAITRAKEEGIPYDLELPFVSAKGIHLWTHTIGRPEFRDGTCVRLHGTFQDITKRRQAEQALRDAERRNRALLDHSPACHKIVDQDLNLQYMNGNGFRMLKLDEDADIYGKPYPFPFFPEAFRSEMSDKLNEVLATGNQLTVDELACDVDGTDVYLHTSLIPILNDNGELDYITVVSADITAERQAQESLAVSEEKFRSIFEHKATATGIFGDDGIITECNAQLSELLGYSRDEIVDKMKWSDVVIDEDLKRLQTYDAQRTHKKGSPPPQYECRLTTKDGSLIDVIVNISLLGTSRIVSLTDITQRKRAEEQYRLLATNTRDVIWIANLDGHFAYVSPSVELLRGYTVEEVMQQTFEDVLTPASMEVATAGIRDLLRVLETGASYPIHEMRELEQVCKDGSTVWTEVVTTTLHGENGELEGILGVSRDISERRQARADLEANEKLLRQTLEATTDGIWTWNFETREMDFSTRYYKMLGYEPDAFPPSFDNWVSLIHPDDREGALAVATNYLETKPDEYENVFRLRSADGTYRWIRARARVVDRNPSGEAVFMIGSHEDVTIRRRAEEKLRSSLEATIQAVAWLIEKRDPYTAGHQRGVMKLAEAIGQAMELPASRIEGIRAAAILHDIGKITAPAEILSKPSALAKTEYALIKAHPEIAYEVLQTIDFPWPVAEIVHQHHERMDGSGYPQGLSGDDILLEARIIAVADVVEAMSSHRPYRPALGIDAALAEIAANRVRLYDAAVVDACVHLFEDQAFEFDADDWQAGMRPA